MELKDLNVLIGMPCYGQVPVGTMNSIVQTMVMATGMGIRCTLGVVSGCSVITAARSQVVHKFLSGDYNRLFWIDADMQWLPEDFLHMLNLSLRPGYDAVASPYSVKQDPAHCLVDATPVVVGGVPQMMEDVETGCVVINGTGLGFTVVSREVVEDVASSKPLIFCTMTGDFVRDVFRIDVVDSGEVGKTGECPAELVGKPIMMRIGEDMAFFSDCRDAGYLVMCNANADIGHIGSKVYRLSAGRGIVK